MDQTVTSDLQDVNTAARRVARQVLDPDAAADIQAVNTASRRVARQVLDPDATADIQAVDTASRRVALQVLDPDASVDNKAADTASRRVARQVLDPDASADIQAVNTAARRVARQVLDPDDIANNQAKNTLAHKTAYKAQKTPGELFLFETYDSSASSEDEISSDSDSSASSESSMDEPTRNNPKRRQKASIRRRERKRAKSVAPGLPDYILDNTGLLSHEEMERIIDSCELTSLTSERANEILNRCHESLNRKFQRKSICSVCDQKKSQDSIHIQRFPIATHADVDASPITTPVSPMDISSPESSIGFEKDVLS